MQLPRITNKQEEILELLYRYRYLNRIQIQALMEHKDRKTINMWLRDLREKEFVGWIYSDHFAEKTKPAIYFLALNGVRWLRYLTNDDGTEYLYMREEVRKRYRDYNRSSTFVTRCTDVAQVAIDFMATDPNWGSYLCYTQPDYLDPDDHFHFLVASSLESQLGPQLIVQKFDIDDNLKAVYLVEFFDLGLPRYRMSKRLKQYVKFLSDAEWEYTPLPSVLIICPRMADLIYAKRRTRGLRGRIWDDEDKRLVKMGFTTIDQLKAAGATGDIWESA